MCFDGAFNLLSVHLIKLRIPPLLAGQRFLSWLLSLTASPFMTLPVTGHVGYRREGVLCITCSTTTQPVGTGYGGKTNLHFKLAFNGAFFQTVTCNDYENKTLTSGWEKSSNKKGFPLHKEPSHTWLSYWTQFQYLLLFMIWLLRPVTSNLYPKIASFLMWVLAQGTYPWGCESENIVELDAM